MNSMVKVIITSDTHQDGQAILEVVKYAKDSGIGTVIDCGDLHGNINCFEGVKVHGVYWEKAEAGMPRGEFYEGMQNIGGVVHENGTTFKLEDMLIYIQHDLAEREKEIPAKRLTHANETLNEAAEAITTKDLKRFLLFGHTHVPHFNDDGKSIAINPGATGLNQGCFVVLDPENNTVEYIKEKESVATIKIGGDIVQMREIQPWAHIERKRNGNEVFVYKTEGQEQRTEEFAKIINASNSVQRGLAMKVANRDGKEQLIKGNFRSKWQEGIGITFEGFTPAGEYTGEYAAYVAKKKVGDNDQEVLVVGAEEKESVAVDKVKNLAPVVKEGSVIFVSQTKTADFKADRPSYDQDKNYTDNLVFNDSVLASYKVIEDFAGRENGAMFRVKDGKEQRAITVNLEGKVQEGKPYASVSDLSDQSRKLIYVAKQNGKMFVVVDGEEQMQHEYDPKSWSQRISSPRIINNGLAYVLDLEKSAALFFNGVEVDRTTKKDSYSGGIKYVESANGELAYMIDDGDGHKRAVLGTRTVIEDANLTAIDCRSGQVTYKLSNKWYSLDGKELEANK